MERLESFTSAINKSFPFSFRLYFAGVKKLSLPTKVLQRCEELLTNVCVFDMVFFILCLDMI